MLNEVIKSGKDATGVLSMLYKDLAQSSAQKIGSALGIVFEYVECLSLPLKLRNEKVKYTFQKNLDEAKRKIDAIPDDKILEVNTHLGVPIIDRLTYITNDEIADLFTTLLSKSASEDTINQAHPSFVQLIDRLSVDEARIIKYLRNQNNIPYVTFRGHLKTGGFLRLKEKSTLITDNITLEFPENELSYLDNLVSMGVLSDLDGTYFTHEDIYKPIYEKNNLEESRKLYVEEQKKYTEIEASKSYFNVTTFGKLFIQACTIA